MPNLEITNVETTVHSLAPRTPIPAPAWDKAGLSDQAPPSLAVEYFHMLVRHRWAVLGAALCGALIGIAVTLPKQPVYQAYTSLEVQGLNENFMNTHAVDLTTTAGADSAESYLQTQIKLIQSQSMIARASKKVKEQFKPAPENRTDVISQVRQFLGFGSAAPIPVDALVKDVADTVKVKPMGLTRLVQINCTSTSPSLASTFCNTLASEFIKNDLEVRSDTAQKTGEYLTEQLQDVRKNLERNEQLLQSYAQQTTLLSSGDKEGVAQDKLRQLQTELSQAQADRIMKQSQYELIASANPDSLPPVLDSGPLREYQTKLSDLKQQYADLSTSFTADYPKVQRLQAQIAELEKTVSKERGNTISRIKNDFEAARHRETLLAAAYGGQTRLVSSLAPKQTQYNMLTREVESGRQLYTTLLQRVKEAGFVSAMHSSPVRIVDVAREPVMPVSPQPVVNVFAGLFLGGAAGVFLAFFKDRTNRRLQKPGEATSQLNLRELGVIPAASVDRLPSPKGKRTLHIAKTGITEQKLLGPAPLEAASGLELVTWLNKGSLMAESYRGVMSSLLFSGVNASDQKIRLLVTSPSVSEGKTTLVSNLGIALAQTKRSVVLIDGDLRRPRLHKIFNLDNSVGLSNVLTGDIDPITCPLDKIVRSTTVPGLYVVPGGPPVDDAASTLFSPHLAPLIDRLQREFAAMLIDSPPMLHLTDARVLARYADGVVLVVRAGATTRDAAMSAQHIFEADGTPIYGTVLNDFDPANDLDLNYYKSYHEYQRQSA
jgi:polysaccharide biosynthesis transport protein